jgi:hypothetical protein
MALCTPVNPGAVWFQTNTGDSYWWDGASWNAMGGGGGGCFVCDVTNSYGGQGALVSHTTATNDTAVGYMALNAELDGGWNTAVGSEALELNTSGDSNTAIGIFASYSNDSGTSNVAVGELSLYNNETGDYNVAVGSRAMEVGGANANFNVAIGNCALQHQEANDATAVGTFALAENTTGYGNVAVGYLALGSNTTGNQNIAVGNNALQTSSIAYDNVAIGVQALGSLTTGYANIAIGSANGAGDETLGALTDHRGCIAIGSECLPLVTERDNIGIGLGALYQADDTYNNIGIGTDALWSFLHGPHANKQGDNIAIGSCALFDVTFGMENIGMGEQFGLYYGEYNVFVGHRAGDSASNTSYNVGIGVYACNGIGGAGEENTAIGSYALGLSSEELNTIDEFSDYSATVAGTVLAHNVDPWGFGLANGVYPNMRITGAYHYNGTYTITVIDSKHFYFTHAWNGDDAIEYWMAELDYALYGNGNVAVGYDAGVDNYDGSYNTYLGYYANADGLVVNVTNSMALGANSEFTKSNQIVIGDGNIIETLLKGVVGINEVTVAAQLDVKQSNAAGAIPVLELHQADQDETFINFVGTSAADQTKSISTINGDGTVTGPKNFSASAGWEYVGMVKIDINGSAYWMPYYQPDIA